MSRTAAISRKTNETDISVNINIDGNGLYDIQTGIGFLDHMLEQLSKHSLVDMTIKAVGDLHIDAHHTSEDIGIALGQAFNQALGNRAGIVRYASLDLAMDETLTKAAVDISGRPYLVWDVDFSRPKIGDYDTELFKEFFHAFAHNGAMTLHVINHYGQNNHHIAETCFKAVARCLRQAMAVDPKQEGIIPSTKGSLTG